MKLLKKFGYPVNLEIKPEIHEGSDSFKITVYLEGHEIDMFYTKDYQHAQKYYARGYLKGLGYDI